MEKLFDNISESDAVVVANYIAGLDPFPNIITLEGNLGAGKTSLVKKLVKALGSGDNVSSPTFSLINEYKTDDGVSIYHSDWYRVKDLFELYDAGIDEYIYSGNLVIIEWPEIGEALLRDLACLHVKIEHQNEKRSYHLQMDPILL